VKVWRCEVDCWYTWRTSKPTIHHRKIAVTVIVQAEDSDSAISAAVAHADATAPIGPKWHLFECRSASSTQLPLTVNIIGTVSTKD
jgi:hypothetical protein